MGMRWGWTVVKSARHKSKWADGKIGLGKDMSAKTIGARCNQDNWQHKGINISE